nr:MAG: ORF1 [Torque teno midi virus]
MPFWWQRRKRFWRGRRRPFYRRWKRKPRRRTYRRKNKRTYRRRRRRRTKVRRKKKTITVKQWQPEYIRNCKIKGYTINVLGGQGRQFACYTDSKYDWNLPTTPGGGGFGVEKYTLQYFYEENKRGNNIWTQSNQALDLVRYTGTTFKFFRHEHLDFIISYSRNYPMILEKYTYAMAHPYMQLMKKHHKIIPSLKTQPTNRKRYYKVKIKPPRQLVNKWFFQDGFSDTGLFTLYSAVIDLRYSNIGKSSSNQLVSIYILNLQFYENGNWGLKSSDTIPYKPRDNSTTTGTYTGKDYKGSNISFNISATTYDTSVSYGSGWFQTKLLQVAMDSTLQNVPAISTTRYNPTIDTGIGNAVWVTSILTKTYAPPTTDTQLYLEGLPLWHLLFGFLNYVNKIKGDKYFLKTYILVFKCKFCEPQNGVSHYFVPIDKTFILGQNPYGRYSYKTDNTKWFPNITNQLEAINEIVQSGPYIPKLDNARDSTWELDSHYISYFKWGGAQHPETITADPSKQADYEVPDKLRQIIQISNPSKQDPKSILHAWDYRRGFATKSALKRMLENAETDTSFQISTDTESTPKKKKKRDNTLPLQEKTQEEEEACLLSLFEENIYQETPQTSDLLNLIQQQQHKQQQIKLDLLKLISNLKAKQKIMELQTGLLS